MAVRRGQGEGSIFYRKDRERWMAQITLPNGKQRTQSCETKEKARDALLQMRIAGDKAEAVRGGDPRLTFGDYLWSWCELRSADWTYRTLLAAQSNIRRVTKVLGNRKLARLTEMDFRELLIELKQEFSPQTIHLTWHTAKAALADAVEDGLIPSNPMGGRLKPTHPRRQERTVLSEAQVAQLLEISRGTRWHAMWALLALRGLRSGEVRGLKWDDVEWDRAVLHIRRQASYDAEGMKLMPPKTKSSRRLVLLPEVCVRALREHKALQEGAGHAAEWNVFDLIFPKEGGGIMATGHINPYLDKDLARAGLPHLRMHDLRHTAGTLLAEKGEHPVAIAALLGHSGTETTNNVYTQATEVLQRSSVALIDTLFLHEDKSEGKR